LQVTLCDTGPLVALINAADKDHARCVAALHTITGPLVTTWPCVTEAMYLVGRHGGFPAQDELWTYLEDGLVSLHATTHDERGRMRALMTGYRDTPMDIADASVVSAAEVLNVFAVFTL